MADTKISALPASTTPLAGTEVLPIVQDGATKQVSVTNLTAGRAVSAASVTASTGNFVVGTSGQGIDFSATPGTGTSELLADYEEGFCTLGIAFGGGTTGITYGGRPISYVKVGSLVTVTGYIGLSNKGSSTGNATITGLPFTIAASADGGYAAVTLSAANLSFVGQYSGYTVANGTTVNLYQTASTGTLSALTDVNFANNTEIEFCIHYRSV